MIARLRDLLEESTIEVNGKQKAVILRSDPLYAYLSTSREFKSLIEKDSELMDEAMIDLSRNEELIATIQREEAEQHEDAEQQKAFTRIQQVLEEDHHILSLSRPVPEVDRSEKQREFYEARRQHEEAVKVIHRVLEEDAMKQMQHVLEEDRKMKAIDKMVEEWHHGQVYDVEAYGRHQDEKPIPAFTKEMVTNQKADKWWTKIKAEEGEGWLNKMVEKGAEVPEVMKNRYEEEEKKKKKKKGEKEELIEFLEEMLTKLKNI